MTSLRASEDLSTPSPGAPAYILLSAPSPQEESLSAPSPQEESLSAPSPQEESLSAPSPQEESHHSPLQLTTAHIVDAPATRGQCPHQVAWGRAV